MKNDGKFVDTGKTRNIQISSIWRESKKSFHKHRRRECTNDCGRMWGQEKDLLFTSQKEEEISFKVAFDADDIQITNFSLEIDE